MNAHLRWVVLAFGMLVSAAPCSEAPGPALIDSGEGYAITWFTGSVQDEWRDAKYLRPGIVIVHTDLRQGTAQWLIRTGTIEIPTERVSYDLTRLAGLLQNDRYLVCVTYQLGRQYDRLPYPLPADAGFFRVEVFEKRTGKRRSADAIPAKDSHLEAVPKETVEAGVLEKTGDGFVLFGKPYVLTDKGAQLKEPPKKPTAAKP